VSWIAKRILALSTMTFSLDLPSIYARPISRDLLRNPDRLFGSGFLLWHYSRIRNHFRDVDRL
jgi:hypothetical protein